MLAYGLLGLAAVGLTWWVNFNPIRADMRFQQGQGLSEQDGLSLERLVQALDEYLATVRMNPREDFYYLNLGRVLMTMADSVRAQGVPLGAAAPAPRVEDLLRLNDAEALVGFVQTTPPMAMMSYAEAVLLRAHDLNPRNKDHFANLGRLNSYWYSWTSDPERLRASLDWYERVTPIAPQDVTLLNERAGVLMQLGDYGAINGDEALAQSYYGQAGELLRHSAELDPRYADTFMRLGDLALAQGEGPEAAVEQYVRAIEQSGATVAGAIERIADDLGERRDLIGRLRDAYAAHTAVQEQLLAERERNPDGLNVGVLRERVALLHTVTGLLAVRAGDAAGALGPYKAAVQVAPTNSTYSRNYAIVLSDTMRHDEAIAETRRLIGALQSRPGSQQAIAEAEGLIAIFEQARGQ